MNKLILWLGLSVLFACALTETGAQSGGSGTPFPAADGVFYHDQLEHAIEIYERFEGGQAELYSGRGYTPYVYPVEGHPFVVSEEWKQGEILYKGRLYRGVQLLYDIARDEVLVHAYKSPIRIVLQNEQIEYFEFPSYRFIRVDSDSASSLPAGFYHAAYEGNVKVLVRMTKRIMERISEMTVKRKFLSKDYFYLVKDGIYYPADSKQAVLKVLADRKGPLKKYLRQQKIRFRQDPGAAITKMAEYYDKTSSL